LFRPSLIISFARFKLYASRIVSLGSDPGAQRVNRHSYARTDAHRRKLPTREQLVDLAAPYANSFGNFNWSKKESFHACIIGLDKRLRND